MPANTLVSMAMQTAIRNMTSIEDFADLPYDIVRPILLKLQSPQQLHQIERNCPQIAEQSEELWRAFIARDIPDWEKKLVYPKNPSSWNKVYRLLQRREEKKAAEDEEALRKAVQGENLKKATNKALIVQQVMPHARDESSAFVDGVKKGRGSGGWQGFDRTPTLKNAKTGHDALAAIRRQTAQASRDKSRGQPWQGPSSAQKLATAKRQITAAPQSMVRETTQARTNQNYTIAPRELLPHEKSMMDDYNRNRVKIQLPARKGNAKMVQRNQQAVDEITRKARAENEAKLLALTQPQRRTSTAKKTAESAQAPGTTQPARTASPATTTSRPPPPRHVATPVAASSPQPSAADAPSPPMHPVAGDKRSSPESSPPPKILKKRPAANIFMTSANKKRKV